MKTLKQFREEKAVWDKPNPKAEAGKSEKLSPAQKARARARARAAGRSYPNMVDNIWAARNEAVDAQDAGEYDYEGDMAMSDLRSIIYNAQRLHDMMKKNTNLPEWLQAKITKAEDYISSAANYMQSEMSEETVVETIRKMDNKYVIFSKDGSKRLGTYDSESAAKKRLKQIEYFKHMGEELGRDNEIGRPELTSKLMALTPGQTALKLTPDFSYSKDIKKQPEPKPMQESGGAVVYKSGADHIEKYADDSFAVYKNGTKKTFYTTLAAAKSALSEEEKKSKPLNRPFLTPGGPKKRAVYVKDPATGNIKKVSFGDTTGLTIKTNDPDRRRNFRARHNCDTPGPKTKARYWSCRAWSADTVKKGLGTK